MEFNLEMLKCVILIIISYFVGNISPAILISKGIYGTDVRSCGSGNAGTTNMLRNFGKKAAAATLMIDALKCVPCVLLGNYLIGDSFGMWCGLAVIVGHIWPVCYQWKGGKGVATTIGCGFAVAPGITFICILIGLAVVAITRRISMASLLGIAAFPFLVLSTDGSRNLFLWSLACTAIIWLMHRANIKRILKGEEPKLSFKK